VSFAQITTTQGADRETTSAVLDLTLDGSKDGRLVPRLEYYPASDQYWTRVARHSSVEGDVYVTLLGADPAARAVSIRMEVHTLIV
jgi:cytochrome c biogenesis factor